MGAVCMICGRSLPDDSLSSIESMYKMLKHRGDITIVERKYDPISVIIGIIKKDALTPELRELEQSIEIIDKMGDFQDTSADTDDRHESLHIVISNENGVTIARGNFYMRGAFYAESNNIFYFATERKAFGPLELQNISRLETGYQISYDGREASNVRFAQPLIASWTFLDRRSIVRPPTAVGNNNLTIRVKVIRDLWLGVIKLLQTMSKYVQVWCSCPQPLEAQAQGKDISEDTLVEHLADVLLRSFKRLQGMNTGILFSGGVDSGLVAHLSKRFCKRTVLYSVNAESSHDAKAAARAADLLNMELRNITIDADSTWSLLPEVIYAIEDSNRMNVAIALPFMVAAKAANKDGYGILLSGQGPDELFAGYARHVKIMQERGSEALERELLHEVSITHRANLERDEKAVAYGGCDLIFPYLYNDFVSLALGIPARWKIRIEESITRKYIFRELAQELGLPKELAWAPKRATQFSSSSDKLLISAVHSNIGKPNNFSKKGSERLVQVVLDRIAQELGVDSVSTVSEYDIDWSPVVSLVRNNSIRQQSAAR
ncbi:MAG: hypothetical protein K9W43_06405 [Candidatus Thorarchaeota archaeon]|nr:hypothetical protein [Candidatus Thorarchaeota archaeon]